MKDLLKRMERVKAALERRQPSKVTLLLTDGSRLSAGLLEAVDMLCRRDDVVDVLAGDDTTASLLRGMIGPWDFSDLQELAGQEGST